MYTVCTRLWCKNFFDSRLGLKKLLPTLRTQSFILCFREQDVLCVWRCKKIHLNKTLAKKSPVIVRTDGVCSVSGICSNVPYRRVCDKSNGLKTGVKHIKPNVRWESASRKDRSYGHWRVTASPLLIFLLHWSLEFPTIGEELHPLYWFPHRHGHRDFCSYSERTREETVMWNSNFLRILLS